MHRDVPYGTLHKWCICSCNILKCTVPGCCCKEHLVGWHSANNRPPGTTEATEKDEWNEIHTNKQANNNPANKRIKPLTILTTVELKSKCGSSSVIAQRPQEEKADRKKTSINHGDSSALLVLGPYWGSKTSKREAHCTGSNCNSDWKLR